MCLTHQFKKEADMPAPHTLVILEDEDGDEFPVMVPGVYANNRGADIAAALQIIEKDEYTKPRGELTCKDIEYYDPFGAKKDG